jgi:hypothetical protein
MAGESLDFADGMTVIVGSNESAKSSWHAAVFAAVCGRRRGKGKPREDDQRFAELHKPWDRDDWLVTAELALDDGRRVEMRQELNKRVDCHAKDLALGTDISDEVMHDGAPDGARWLGLDRGSFLATACVEQAQLLGVLSQAEGLQSFLQRAASSAGTDSTAAAAIECIAKFESEHVGLDRAHAVRPLRRAVLAHAEATAALEVARGRHADYLNRVEQVDAARARAAEAEARLSAYEALAAERSAAELRAKLDRVGQLVARFGSAPPASVLDDDALTRRVHEALALWASRPQEPPATDAEESFPADPPPDGDLQVHDSVERAMTALTTARTRWTDHQQVLPPAVEVPDVAATDAELLDVAHRLEAPLSAAPQATATPRRGGRGLVLAGTGLTVVGLVLLVSVSTILGALLAVAGVAGAALGLIRRVTRGSQTAAVLQERAAAAGRDDAVRWCAEHGLPPDPAVLRDIPVRRMHATAQRQAAAAWQAQTTALTAALTAAEQQLAGALAARGVLVGSTEPSALVAAADAYRLACRHRAALRADADRQARAEAAARVIAAAAACGLAADSPQRAAEDLAEWDERRKDSLSLLADHHQAYAEIAALLDGRTVEQRAAELADLTERANRLLAGVDQAVLARLRATSPAPQLGDLRQAASAAGRQAADAEGELREFAHTVGSVAEAEEALAAAQAELDRVRELSATLERTRDFLTRAQERVHRDIAPVLAESVRGWLPAVTDGRYTDVIVSPTDLSVQVRAAGASQWRSADRLSYGTGEQIYLLLRVSLADQLTRGHDTCPLILDDVTVHADAARTREVLTLLHDIARERQVILFTQEEQVAQWAKEHLTGPDDRMHSLAPVRAA